MDDLRALFDSPDESFVRSRRGAKWSKYGPDVLSAWVADMDFPAAPCVTAALQRQIDTSDYGYPWLTPNPVIQAFVGWASRRYGWEIDPERVMLTTDVLQPIAGMIDVFTEPGDGIVVQTPIYPPFLRSTEESQRVIVDNPLGPPEAGYPLDAAGLAACIDDRTRILLVCNPHNPTGRAFTRAELTAIGELAVERDLLVICDEIWADFIYPGHVHVPFATLSPEIAARTVTLTAATKSFSFAGLRLAVAVFGSAEIQQRYSALGRFLLGGACSSGAFASEAAWTEGDSYVDALCTYLDDNRRLVHDTVTSRMAGVSFALPESTYLAWLDCRQLVASGRMPSPPMASPQAFFLDRARVALNDGAEFGPNGEGYCRLNFATSRTLLVEILDRMVDALA